MYWPASYAPSPTRRSSPAPGGADPSPRWQSADSVSHASQLGGTVSLGLPGARPGAVWADWIRRIVDTKQTNILACCRWLPPPATRPTTAASCVSGGLWGRQTCLPPAPAQLDSLAGRDHLIGLLGRHRPVEELCRGAALAVSGLGCQPAMLRAEPAISIQPLPVHLLDGPAADL